MDIADHAYEAADPDSDDMDWQDALEGSDEENSNDNWADALEGAMDLDEYCQQDALEGLKIEDTPEYAHGLLTEEDIEDSGSLSGEDTWEDAPEGLGDEDIQKGTPGSTEIGTIRKDASGDLATVDHPFEATGSNASSVIIDRSAQQAVNAQSPKRVSVRKSSRLKDKIPNYKLLQVEGKQTLSRFKETTPPPPAGRKGRDAYARKTTSGLASCEDWTSGSTAAAYTASSLSTDKAARSSAVNAPGFAAQENWNIDPVAATGSATSSTTTQQRRTKSGASGLSLNEDRTADAIQVGDRSMPNPAAQNAQSMSAATSRLSIKENWIMSATPVENTVAPRISIQEYLPASMIIPDRLVSAEDWTTSPTNIRVAPTVTPPPSTSLPTQRPRASTNTRLAGQENWEQDVTMGTQTNNIITSSNSRSGYEMTIEHIRNVADSVMDTLADQPMGGYATNQTVSSLLLTVKDLQARLDNLDMNSGSASSRTRSTLSSSLKKKSQGPRPNVQHRNAKTCIIQCLVRLYCMHLMKRDVRSDPIPVVDQRTVALFERGVHPGPSSEDFRLDLDSKELKGSKWNKKALNEFVTSFISSGWSTLKDSPEGQSAAHDCILAFLPTLKAQYRLQKQNGVLSQEQRDAFARKGRENRRRTRHVRRQAVVTQERGLTHHVSFMASTNYLAASGDESEGAGDDKRYVRTRLRWRSDEYTTFLYILDLLHLSTHFKDNGDRAPGSLPSYRIKGSARVEHDDRAVPGLPRNCYNAAWLITLTDEEQQELKMQPNRDLTVPENLVAKAARYRRIKKKKDTPLPLDGSYDLLGTILDEHDSGSE